MSSERAGLGFRVREAVSEDHHVLQLILDGSLGTTGTRVYGMSVDELLRHNRIYVAFLQDRPMGCVMGTLTWPVILHGLHVVPEHRSAGHAGSLIASAIAQMDGDGLVEFWTAVDPARPSSIDRFGALGFSELKVDFVELSALLSGMCVMVRPAPIAQDRDGPASHD